MLGLALSIIIIDTTLLNVSLRTIIEELHTDIHKLQWVISAYALTLAALTITGGRLGDLFGRKRMFVLGAIIFAIGSFIASISHSVGMLLLGESFIEGIGAALMMPATASLLVANFYGRERAIAFGVWGGLAGASSAIGPILGGYLTSNFSWRWGFRINVFVAAILVIGSVLVRDSRDDSRRPSLDVFGVILSAIGLTAIIFGIIEASTYGWFFAKQSFAIGGWTLPLGALSVVPFSLVLGAIFLLLFGLWELRRERADKTPLVSLGIFRNHQFTSGVITTGIISIGQSGIIFAIPVFLQGVRGLDALHTGLALLPLSLVMLIVAPLSGVLTRYTTAKRLVQIGLFINFVAILVLYWTLNPDTTPWQLAPGLGLYGLGMGFVMAQISNLSLSAVPVREAGEASGINNTLRQIGQSLGSAIIGSVLLTVIATNVQSSVAASPDIPADLRPELTTTLTQSAADLNFSELAGNPNLSPAVTQEIQTIMKDSMTEGNRQSLLYTALFSFLGFLTAFSLPNRKLEQQEKATAVAGH